MKANGELDAAKHDILWAENEEEPKIIEPYPLRNLTEEDEERIRIGVDSEPIFKIDKDKMDDNEVDYSFIFHPVPHSLNQMSTYPSTWPLVPFIYPTQSLQTRLPLHYLPKTITVHDPWNLLAVDSSNRYGRAGYYDRNADWTSVADRTHTFELELSPAGERRLREEVESTAGAAQT